MLLPYILKRVLWVLPVLLLILVVIFLLIHAIPGSPWDAEGQRVLPNISLDPITRASLNRRFGLDEPLWRQFTSYVIGRAPPGESFICGVICGNLGPSYRSRGRMVQDMIFQPPKDRSTFESRFWYSLRLALYAFAMALGIGLPLGVWAALRVSSWADYAIKILSTMLIALPNFVIGFLIIIILGGELHWIVISPSNWRVFDPRVWFAPIFILGVGTLAAFIRLTRASVLEVMRKDYIRTARGKGAPERRVTWLHMLRNALIPIITFSGPALLELLAGSFVIETMFGYPGMGKTYIDAILERDYPVVMGITLVYAILVAGSNLLVDMMYGTLDPRIRLSEQEEAR